MVVGKGAHFKAGQNDCKGRVHIAGLRGQLQAAAAAGEGCALTAIITQSAVKMKGNDFLQQWQAAAQER